MSRGSLIFDLEAVDASKNPGAPTHEDRNLTAAVQSLLSPQSSLEHGLRKDAEGIQRSILAEDGQVDSVVLASRLAAIGYRVAIRTAVGGGAGQQCFKNLHHVFLLVSGLSGLETEFIIDPNFRDQFRIPQPTPKYTCLLRLLPTLYVGTSTRLTPLVKALSIEIELAFHATGITMPPWRRAESMMSKWNPSKARDQLVQSPLRSHKIPEGVSPRGPLSLCSSRSSSLDLSPERMRMLHIDLPPSTRRENEPRKIQAGFTPVPQGSSTPRPAEPKPVKTIGFELTRRPAMTCTSSANLGMRAGRHDMESSLLPHIRTVKMSGARG